MSSKFYIHGGGRWREIDLETGCVSGWGRASFVYVRDGRLEVARRRRVLRALRSLAVDSPSAAKANIVLSDNVPSPALTLKVRSKSPVQWKTNRCNDDRFNKVLKETSSVGIQCNTTVDAANTMICPQHNNNANENKILPLRRNGKFNKSKSNKIHKKTDKVDRELIESNQTKENSTEGLDSEKSDKSTKNAKKRRQQVKELLIEEEVVEILRRYLKKNNLGVDSKRYDIDDAYKEQVFYKINPMVVVEQCPQIKRMLQSRTVVSENYFMRSLGLQSSNQTNKRHRSESTSSTSQSIQDNKENELQRSSKRNKGLKDSVIKKYKSSEKQVSPQKRKVVLLSSKSDSDFQEPRLSPATRVGPRVNGLHEPSSSPLTSPDKETVTGAPSGPKAPSRAAGNSAASTRVVGTRVVEGVGGGGRTVYSPLEDQAIISWVQRGDRARLVNGNRLWRDLPPHHAAHTGVSRSWHSLRNRYLRHILPTLAHIAPSALAATLRAAAATGEIKQKRNKQNGNNSMFAMPRVRSAWAPHRARLLSPHRPSPPPSPPPSLSGKPSPPRVAKRTARANPPRSASHTAGLSPPSRKRTARTTNSAIPRRAARVSPVRAAKRTARANSSTSASPPRVAKRTARASAPGSGKRTARANSSTSASPPRVAKRTARASAPGSGKRTARANSSTSASPPRKAKGSPPRVAKRTARTSMPCVAKRPVRASALHSASRTTWSVSSTSGSSPCSSRSPGSPPRAAKRRSRTSSSSSGSPAPAASSTHTEDALHMIHTARERSRLSKRYSELRRRFDDVEESSDEARRVLRPRSDTRGSDKRDSAGRLRHRPKKRRLYNPEVI